jgi:uncharacterized OsmC-like protein
LLVIERSEFGHGGDDVVGGERAQAGDAGEDVVAPSELLSAAISASSAATWRTICSRRWLELSGQLLQGERKPQRELSRLIVGFDDSGAWEAAAPLDNFTLAPALHLTREVGRPGRRMRSTSSLR